MAMLMRLINLLPVEIDISGIVKEVKRQLHQEADYIIEAQYLSEYRVPPPETLFLHRKLVGSFMLCSRIGACEDVQKLISPFLPAS